MFFLECSISFSSSAIFVSKGAFGQEGGDEGAGDLGVDVGDAGFEFGSGDGVGEGTLSWHKHRRSGGVGGRGD